MSDSSARDGDAYEPGVAGPSLPRVCVVGCGRSYRRDDQAGILIAADISRHVAGTGIIVLATEAPGTDLLAYCEGADLLVVIDAAEAGSDISPGKWMRIDYPAETDGVLASTWNEIAAGNQRVDVSLYPDVPNGLTP